MSFVKYVIESDIGRKRALNEDRAAFFERPSSVKLAILADGMGGHNAGDVASEMAVNFFESYFYVANEEVFETDESVKEWLLQGVKKLNYDMYQYSLSNQGLSGMGTTLIVSVIMQSKLIISHVGDSRLYTFANDHATLVTKDHSYVNMLLELGQINAEEAHNHPKKNAILKAIGTEETIEPDLIEVDIDSIEHAVICSDGLSNKLTQEELTQLLALPLSLNEKGKKLIEIANERGGEDNISFVLMQFHDVEV